MNAEVRELTLLVEAYLPRLLVRRDAEGDVLPTQLAEIDVSRGLDIVLPAAMRVAGRLVTDEDCASLAEAVRDDLRVRHRRNRRLANVEDLEIRVLRSQASESSRRPVVCHRSPKPTRLRSRKRDHLADLTRA